MTKHQLYRWFLFFVFGLPVQLLVYALHILAVPYYVLYARNKNLGVAPKPVNDRRWGMDQLFRMGRADPIRDHFFLDHQDDHSALIHMYTWILRSDLGYGGLKILVEDYYEPTLRRRWPDGSATPVSGDCLGSWTCAYAYRLRHGLEVPKKELKILTDSYIRNCFGLSVVHWGNKVSNRSSNGGMSYTPDSWGGINQPCLGPQNDSKYPCRCGCRLAGQPHARNAS